MIFLFHQFIVVLLYTSITYFLLFPYAENISFSVVRPLKIIAPHSKARTRIPNYKAMDQVVYLGERLRLFHLDHERVWSPQNHTGWLIGPIYLSKNRFVSTLIVVEL